MGSQWDVLEELRGVINEPATLFQLKCRSVAEGWNIVNLLPKTKHDQVRKLRRRGLNNLLLTEDHSSVSYSTLLSSAPSYSSVSRRIPYSCS